MPNTKNRVSGLFTISYEAFFFFKSKAFFPPKAAPAAIRRLTPPSIGHTVPKGPPQGGAPPLGGVGGAWQFPINGIENRNIEKIIIRFNLLIEQI